MAIYSKVSGIGASLLKGIDGISIANIRSINASLSSAFALLLDERYGFGAEAAYSVRRLSGLYNGPLLVVRRDSDDATLEVGFTSSNDLDVSAIETFCGTANGYVTEWRDQSGNLNHATQPALTSQPKIYDATTGVVTENGKPAIQGAGGSVELVAAISHTVTAQSTFGTGTYVYGTNDRFISQNNGGNDYSGSDSYIIGYASATNTISSLLDAAARGSITVSNNQHMLFSSVHSGSSLLNAVNGTTGTAYAHSLNSTFSRLGIMGTGGSVAEGWKGKMQEVVMYDADKSTDRTSIESNIGDYFTQNTPLLDTYTGAAAAYSLRKLSSSYSGPLVRVREDGGDTQADIYANVFGELDTITLANHCGSNNGLVVGWYDQSGNLNHATQPSLTAQPKIYDATTGVVKEHNKPCAQFDGTNDSFEITPTISAANGFTAAFVSEISATGAIEVGLNVRGANCSAGNQFFYSSSTGLTYANGRTSSCIYQSVNALGMKSIAVGLWDWANNTLNVEFDGIAVTPNTSLTETSTTIDRVRLGRDSGNNYADCKIHECIIWPSNSLNISSISDNINDFYGIYDTGLIGEYSGAAAAYSLRSLSSVYDGAAITVRRDSDDSTKNIYFDSDGNLDTAALTGFCGNNNGYVVRWFDQSSNNNHATQASDIAQPKIYDGTTGVVLQGGKPTLKRNASGSIYMSTPHFGSTSSTASIFTVVNPRADRSLIYQSGGYIASENSGALSIYYGSFISGTASTVKQRIQTYLIGSTDYGYIDGTLNVSGNAGSSLLGGAGNIGGQSTTFRMPEEMQEIIIYLNDQSANRTNIEDNINNNYLIYQPDTAPTSGLLATYSGAAAAYSLRQLSNEAVIAVTVRRDSDDAQANIGFDGRELDTNALAAWCGNANGYVVKWWDQSTFGNHATQASDTSQPKIYDSVTGVVTENGKPAVFFEADIMNFTLPSMTEGEVYRVLRAANDPSTGASEAGGDKLGTGWNSGANSHYPWTNGSIYDSTGRNVRLSFNPTANLAQQHLLNILSKSGEWTARINGTQEYTTASNTVGFRTSNSFGQVGTAQLKHHYQEFVIWPSDQSSNRTGIENDIFSFYTSYLLDQYSGAATAYSLRALSSTSTNAVQVRRDSDDATQYIGFVRDGFSLSLDTSALSTFCGSANGYVSEWVDQSGNNNHAAQAVLTSQPKIYDGTTGVLTDNGKPCVQFTRTSSTGLIVPSTSWSTAGQANFYMVWNNNGGVGDQRTWQASLQMFSGNTLYRVDGGGTSLYYTEAKVANQNLFNYAHGTTSKTIYIDGAQDATSGTPGTISTSSSTGAIAIRNSNNQASADIFLQELIHYPTDQSGNRTNIEDNINGYYDIY